MNRTMAETKEYYRVSLGHSVKYISETRLQQNFPLLGNNVTKNFVVHAHKSTITVDASNESFSLIGEESYTGFNPTFTYGPSSFVLTVVAKNLTEARKFNNTSGAFGGLFICTKDTNMLYRMVSNGTTVTAVRMMGFDEQRSNCLPWFNGTLLTGTELVWV
jgi:hypothetical protein|tara:strand:+ start:1267 stop:1749 length:483 start_codon:yes stop_codon:yes gene_type:complete